MVSDILLALSRGKAGWHRNWSISGTVYVYVPGKNGSREVGSCDFFSIKELKSGLVRMGYSETKAEINAPGEYVYTYSRG